MISESKKRNNAKWDRQHMATLGCRMRKEKLQEYRVYAEKQGLTASKFARLAMDYCKDNNILLINKDDEQNIWIY